MGVLEVPLHEVNIKSSLINGNIVIGMRPSLPVEGISLILGNDLVGERVMVDPRVVEKPRDYKKPFKLIIDSSDVGTGSVLVQEASDGLGQPCQLFFEEMLKISKELFSGRKRNIMPIFSLRTF